MIAWEMFKGKAKMAKLDKVKVYAILMILCGFAYVGWGRWMDHEEALATIALSHKQAESEIAWASLELAEQEKPWYSKIFSTKREYEPGIRRNHK